MRDRSSPDCVDFFSNYIVFRSVRLARMATIANISKWRMSVYKRVSNGNPVARLALVASLFTLLTGTAAFAQDDDAFGTNWSGFYGTIGGGYGSWSGNTRTISPTSGNCVLCTAQSQGGNGGFGTVGLGYDRQLDEHLVAGIFSDADFGRVGGTIQDQTAGLAGNFSEDTAWTAGGRLGWLITPGILPYVDAGFTKGYFGRAKMVDSATGVYSGYNTPSFSQGGWFVGVGAEASVAPHLFLRGEYRVSQFGTETIPDSNGTTSADNIAIHPQEQTFRLALVYKIPEGF
jgi:outer membrane immunogenic protein